MNVDPCPLAGHVITACATSISDAVHDQAEAARPLDPASPRLGLRRQGRRRPRDRDDQFGVLAAEGARCRVAQVMARRACRMEGRGKAKRKTRKRQDPEPKRQRLLTNDATVETMSEILEARWADREADASYGRAGHLSRRIWPLQRQRRVLRAGVMLEAYDGGPQRIDRIKRGHVYVPNWSLVVAGNIQPRRFASMAPYLIDDGLFQRFLTSTRGRPRLASMTTSRPRPASGGTIASSTRHWPECTCGGGRWQVAALLLRCGRPRRAPRFMRLVERLQADPTLPTIIRETAPKWSGLLARLALVFHLVELAEQRNNGAVLSAGGYLPRDRPDRHHGGNLPSPHRSAQPVPARIRDHARGGRRQPGTRAGSPSMFSRMGPTPSPPAI